MAKKDVNTSTRNLADLEGEFFDENLTYSIIVIANLIGRNTANSTLSEYAISINEWRILRMAYIFGPVCASDIINTIGMDKSNVSRGISSILKAGYIELAPNPDDRRQTMILLTGKGRKLHNKIAPLDQEVDRSFERLLSKQEIASFHKIMHKLRPHAHKLLSKVSGA